MLSCVSYKNSMRPLGISNVFHFLLSCFVLYAANALQWNYACPVMCRCSVSIWNSYLFDVNTVDCSNISLLNFPHDIPQRVEVLILRHNLLGSKHHNTVLNLPYTRKIKYLDISFNRIKTFQSNENDLDSLEYLNLSYNNLVKLERNTFSGFRNLQTLNLRANQIILVTEDALELPKLTTLELSENKISFLMPHYFVHLRELKELLLAKNHISRVSQIFQYPITLDVLDLSGNKITKIDEKAFRYMITTKEFNLGGNHLSNVPRSALSVIPQIEKLLMNANLFNVISPFSFSDVNVSYLDISDNTQLSLTEKHSFANMNHLTHLKISNNKNFKYFHPESLINTSRLNILDLRNNSLFLLQKEMFKFIPSLKILFTSGNHFSCDCTVRWIQEVLQNSSLIQSWKLSDINEINCIENNVSFPLKHFELLPPHCIPAILPLFPSEINLLPGSNIKLPCIASGVPVPEVSWVLPESKSENTDINCYYGGCTFSLQNMQSKDNGTYTCIARNSIGTSHKNFVLGVTDLNITLRPVTVASTFITISWSRINYFRSNYIIQYKQSDLKDIISKVMVLGWKAHTYTLSGLTPGKSYTIWLCVQRENSILRLSYLNLTTKEYSLTSLAIRTDYTTVFITLAAAIFVTITCFCFCGVRVCKRRKCQHTEMILSENRAECVINEKNCGNPHLAFSTYVCVADEMTLVEDRDEKFQ